MSPRTHVNLRCGLENRHNPRTSVSSRWEENDWCFVGKLSLLALKTWLFLNYFPLQARSLETKQLWVKELREVIQQFQFGTLRERSKTPHFTFRLHFVAWLNRWFVGGLGLMITETQTLRLLDHPTCYWRTTSNSCHVLLSNRMKSELFFLFNHSHLNDELNKFCDNHSLD